MNRFSHIISGFLLTLCLTGCCSSKKPTQQPANKALPERNTKDPKIDSSQKKVEKTTFELKAG
jgi:predicted component of type VI protein secretion system